MSDPPIRQPPVRFIEDPDAGEALRADLQYAADAQVHGLDEAAGLARLEAATGAASAGMTTAKVVAGIAVISAVAWLALRDPNPAPAAAPTPVASVEPAPASGSGIEARTPAPAMTPVPAASPEPALDERPDAPERPLAVEPDEAVAPDEVVEPGPDPSLEPADAASDPATAPAPRARPAADDRDPEPAEPDMASVLEEAKRVKAARRWLERDPAEALAATERIAEDFPTGQLVEERRAIAIQALAALGRTDEARERAESFLRRYGRGPHAAAVRRAVDGPSP